MPWGIAGAAIGAIGSMSAADSAASAAENAKNPWKGAEPWIMDNIESGQQLQQHYAQNPFNAIQQQGMQGLLANYQAQNNQVIPGLLGFANQLMGQNYQRGQPQQSGLMASQPVQQPAQQPQMLQQQPSGVFAAPPQQTTQLDFNALNPLYVDPASVPAPYQPTDAEIFRQNMADALFPEADNPHRYGIGPSLEEQYLRNLLGRPSRLIDVQGA